MPLKKKSDELVELFCPFFSRRQALAFTSKTPGKTQQFNYFMMNNNTENAFYLVDMPGMGYAKVTKRTSRRDPLY